MVSFIFFILFVLAILAIVFYAIFAFMVAIVKIFKDGKDPLQYLKTKKFNRSAIFISLILSAIVMSFEVFYNPAHNFKTAYIEKAGDKYCITLYRKANLMVHDPISLLMKGTYIDSQKFIIPRSEGVIDGLELPTKQGYYKPIKGGAFTIHEGSLKVSAYYNNYDEKKIDPSVWNGEYQLTWR